MVKEHQVNRFDGAAAKKLLFVCLFLMAVIVLQSVLLVRKQGPNMAAQEDTERQNVQETEKYTGKEEQALTEPFIGSDGASLVEEADSSGSGQAAYDAVMQFLNGYYENYGNSPWQREVCAELLTEEAADNLFPETLFQTPLEEKEFQASVLDKRICVMEDVDQAVSVGYYRCEIAGDAFTSISWYLLDVELVRIGGGWKISRIHRMDAVRLED